MRRSNRERLVDAARAQLDAGATGPAVTLNIEQLCARVLGKEMNPTQRKFIYSNTKLRALKGNAGSAKTTTLLMTLLLRALFHRGYRGVMGRYDYNKLRDTAFPLAEQMMMRLPKGVLLDRDKDPPARWWIRPAVEGGELKPSMITFMGLKDYPGGFQVHGVAIDEADEVEEKTVTGFYSRLRELEADPDQPFGQAPYEEMLAFNPPDKMHWLYPACTGLTHEGRRAERPAYIELFEPAPRENAHNLPQNYYEDMARTLPEDQRQRFVDNQWGSVFPGRPVLREYVHSFHNKVLEPIRDAPIMRFWDFGYRRPFCLFNQFDPEGRLHTLAEVVGENEEVVPFVRRVFTRQSHFFRFTPVEVLDFGDPAAVQRKDTGSTLAALQSVGITLRYKAGLTIESGLSTMRVLLEQIIRGEPAWKIDARFCPLFVAGLRGGYHTDDAGKPVKDGVYDHGVDCARYGITNLYGAGGALAGWGVLARGGSKLLSSNGMPISLEYTGEGDR